MLIMSSLLMLCLFRICMNMYLKTFGKSHERCMVRWKQEWSFFCSGLNLHTGTLREPGIRYYCMFSQQGHFYVMVHPYRSEVCDNSQRIITLNLRKIVSKLRLLIQR